MYECDNCNKLQNKIDMILGGLKGHIDWRTLEDLKKKYSKK